MANKSIKGTDWERELSKHWSLWWTHGEREDVIWRTHGSGSRATARSKRGKGTRGGAGDLMATDPVADPLFSFFLMEAKRGYAKSRPSDSINILYWLDKLPAHKPPLLYEWWMKAEQERMVHQRCESIIIFQRTNKIPVIMLQASLFADIYKYDGQWNYDDPVIEISYRGRRFIFIQFFRFLTWCTPESIMGMLEDRTGGEAPRPRRAIIT
jgi:hypothetical protein